ncbi:MAG: nickel-responsive transcriptional regulator NikR, partial [Candidatus Thorarchaeota archaeon]
MPKKVRVARFSVSLPSTLVEEMDNAWRNMGYESRSKAIHDALRSFITEFEWMREETGNITGAVLVLHYLDKPGLLDEITGIQHKFENVVSSTLHIHLEENKCLEIIAVKGSAREVGGLTRGLMAKKGVKQVKVAIVAR